MLRELETFCRQRQLLFYPKADLPVPDEVLRGHALNAQAQEDQARAAAEVCRRVLGASPASVRPLGEAGTFHILYRAVLCEGRSVIVRLNALSHVWRDFLLCLGPWVATALRGQGLPALEIHHVDISRRLCPYDYEILAEATGTLLSAFDGEEDRFRPLLYELGRFVGRLHGVGTSGFGFFDVRPLVRGDGAGGTRGTCSVWRDYVLRRLDAHIAQCAALGTIHRDEERRIVEAFAAAEPSLADVEPVLLHGDLGSHNVFTDGARITALIDWEDCLSGDPAFDVAFWATFHPDRRHAAFLDGYRRERSLPGDFELRFWLYYLRVALSKTVLRHRLGVADRPGREPAARRIQKGLERVEALQRGRPLAA
jgi:hypothetical protein